MNQRKRQAVLGYLFILPAFICLMLFSYIPILRNFIYSFAHYDMIVGKPQFIGLDNYRELFQDRSFYQSLDVTVRYAIFYVLGTIVIGFFLANLITRKTRFNLFARTLFFLPYVTSMVAISAVFLYIYHPQYGVLNQILQSLGLQPVAWLNRRDTALGSLIAMNIWKSCGFAAVVYLGAILNIPTELYEAAIIDGATGWQKLRYVTLPQVSPSTFLLVIMLTIESFCIFTQVDVMTGGGPAGSTTTLLTFMYQQSYERFRIGYGGAIAIILLLIILLVNVIQMRFERFVHYD